jgi:hypothetical protein
MKPLDLAQQYMAAFFGHQPLESMEAILAPDLHFAGPFHKFNSAAAYMDSLKNDPPANVTYSILHTYENATSACLIYEFCKPGVRTCMAQTFEIKNKKISKIVLIFDRKTFS